MKPNLTLRGLVGNITPIWSPKCQAIVNSHRTSFDFFEEIGIEQLEFAPFFFSDNGRWEP